MANGAQLAMDFIQSNAQIGDNITLVVKDDQGDPGIASRQASAAVAEGASLILGPLKADWVRAAGAVARSAGIPLIGFSNNSGAAAPGVYLLNVLPETEVRRSLAYAKAQGRKAFAAIIPTTDFGRIQEGAFRQAVADLGLNARAVYNFSNETEARTAMDQLVQQLKAGRSTRCSCPTGRRRRASACCSRRPRSTARAVTIMGSADWDGDVKHRLDRLPRRRRLSGGRRCRLLALKPDYMARFGSEPHALRHDRLYRRAPRQFLVALARHAELSGSTS